MTEWKYCPECAQKLVKSRGEDGQTRPECPEGHYVHYDNPAPTAGGIVEKDGKYLVLRNATGPSKGKWEIPGGFIEPGEGGEATFIREMKEETGLDIEIIRYIGSFPSVYGSTGTRTVSVSYHAKVTGGTFKLSAESSESKWVSKDEFPKMAHADDQAAVETFITKKQSN